LKKKNWIYNDEDRILNIDSIIISFFLPSNFNLFLRSLQKNNNNNFFFFPKKISFLEMDLNTFSIQFQYFIFFPKKKEASFSEIKQKKIVEKFRESKKKKGREKFSFLKMKSN